MVFGARRRVPVDAVELLESESTGRLEAVDGLLAVPDGRRRRVTTSHAVLVDGSQRPRLTLRLRHSHTRHVSVEQPGLYLAARKYTERVHHPAILNLNLLNKQQRASCGH